MDKKISGMDLREIDSDILSLGAKKSTQRKGDCETVVEKTSKYQTNKATLSERQNIVFHLKTGVDCGNIAISALLARASLSSTLFLVKQVVPIDQIIWKDVNDIKQVVGENQVVKR